MVQKTLNALLPSDETIIVLNGEAIREGLGAGRRIWPILKRDGEYYGNPSDSRTAMGKLERMRSDGANYPAIWWCSAWRQNAAQTRSIWQSIRTEFVVIEEPEHARANTAEANAEAVTLLIRALVDHRGVGRLSLVIVLNQKYFLEFLTQ